MGANYIDDIYPMLVSEHCRIKIGETPIHIHLQWHRCKLTFASGEQITLVAIDDYDWRTSKAFAKLTGRLMYPTQEALITEDNYMIIGKGGK